MIVVGDGITILNKGYGNATSTQKNDANTVFHIGSVTKQFTAAAIMKLVERGAIDLNGKINQYLPTEYQSEKYWSNITVRELLSHTSGLSNYTENPENPDYDYTQFTRDEVIKNAASQ